MFFCFLLYASTSWATFLGPTQICGQGEGWAKSRWTDGQVDSEKEGGLRARNVHRGMISMEKG